MSQNKPLVLLVEDDLDTARLYQALLTAEFMEVVHCQNCAKAKAWWAQSNRRPDLIVLDMRLPDGDGLMLCQEIMQDQPSPGETPVMVLSAHGDPRLPNLCRRAGAQVFLDKLSGLDQLVPMARNLLENKFHF